MGKQPTRRVLRRFDVADQGEAARGEWTEAVDANGGERQHAGRQPGSGGVGGRAVGGAEAVEADRRRIDFEQRQVVAACGGGRVGEGGVGELRVQHDAQAEALDSGCEALGRGRVEAGRVREQGAVQHAGRRAGTAAAMRRLQQPAEQPERP